MQNPSQMYIREKRCYTSTEFKCKSTLLKIKYITCYKLCSLENRIETFFLLHLLSGMVAGYFAGHFALSSARVAPSSARGPFSGSVHHRGCTGGELGERKGFDLLSHNTFVIICSGEGSNQESLSTNVDENDLITNNIQIYLLDFDINNR